MRAVDNVSRYDLVWLNLAVTVVGEQIESGVRTYGCTFCGGDERRQQD